MKQGKLINAYKVIADLYRQKLPLPTSYKLYKLKGALQKAWDFQIDAEQKLIDEFGAKMGDEGRLSFDNPDKANEFNERLREVFDMESDIDVEPIEIPITDDMSITPIDIENLDGIITFTEG